MKCTTQLELHSQATRLKAGRKTTKLRRHYGLITLCESSFRKEVGRQRKAATRRPYATPHEAAGGDAIRRWADPCSLAVTGGIPVGFFSTAY